MKMRYLLIMILILSGCSSIKGNENEFFSQFSELEKSLSSPFFNKTSRVSINSNKLCIIEFQFTWSEETSKQKGYHSVKTAIEVDFQQNYDNARFISAHYESEDGVSIQRWGNIIEISLLKETVAKKTSLVKENSNEQTKTYLTDYLSIGVSALDNFNQISNLLDTLNSISTICKSQ